MRSLILESTLIFSLLALPGLGNAAPPAQGGGDATVQGQTSMPDEDFDRLDGAGKSGKTVQVIDWEGNMELHVYPPGSLRGLGLKIDRKSKDKAVMVISYRFDNSPTPLIRRALLTMPLTDGFKVFKDPSESEFDKIIISNNGLSGDLQAFKLDPEPKQLYPDGHPALKGAEKKTESAKRATPGNARQPAGDGSGETRPTDENGTIKPFFMDQ